MLNSNYIITFGLTENQNETINNHLKSIKCQMINAASYIELMEANYFLSVINQKELDDKAIKELIKFYTKVDGSLTVKIILSEKIDDLSSASNAKVFKSFDDFETLIGDVLVKAYNKAKKEENIIRNISNVNEILKQLKNNPDITTEKLASKINRNSAAVRRYIEALRIMGEDIVYDEHTHGWFIM